MADVTARVGYRDHQFLRAKDFVDADDYYLDRRRRQNRAFHGVGVVREGNPDSLKVTAVSATRVGVATGWALDESGREIVLAAQTQATVPPAGAFDVFISYPDPEPPPTADQEGFVRIDEAPKISLESPGTTPPGKPLLLATIQAARPISNATIDDKRIFAGVRDNLVTSADIAEADNAPNPATGNRQDTDFGTGVKTGHIADDAVTAVKLADDANDANDAQRAVTTDHIRNDAVTAAKLADDPNDANDAQRAVTTDHIRNDAVTAAKLADDPNDANDAQRAVTTDHIRNDAVTAAKLADDPNDANDAQRAVTTDHIRNDAVTAAKLADDPNDANDAQRAVTTDHIRNDAVTQAKINQRAVSATELKLNSAVTGAETLAVGAETLVPRFPLGATLVFASITIADPPDLADERRIHITEEFAAIIRQLGPIQIPSVGRQWRVRNIGTIEVQIEFSLFRLEDK